ncbi:MAG: 3-hydroxyacyl-CoA dehydrogenase [Desulfobacteraceae bacterium]|jgi:3-hydroxyacyl-CoA dehydrogenase|nr:MAG: 3-hydroxyacyl-CoA dehydrogenase [Desulfobacteraceae bacterium]
MLSSVGVVGGGIMGSGLARYFLAKDFRVILIEADRYSAQKVRGRLENVLGKDVEKGKLAQARAENFLGHLQVSEDISRLAEAEFVIEAVTENLSLKREILINIEGHLSNDAVLCSTTSALPVSAIGAVLARPDRFIGTHFFNPAHIMPLVEVIPGMDTEPDVVEKVKDFLLLYGKRPIKIKECPGFLVNRILGALMNEAMWLLEEGAGIRELDSSAKSIGLPMGPAALGDMVGWDVIYASNLTLETYYGSRFEIPNLLKELVVQRSYGVKSGNGLYDHTKNVPEPSDHLISTYQRAQKMSNEQIGQRLTSIILAESIRCLDEGIASNKDIDMAMTLGAGFTRGPLAWADEIGLKEVLENLLRYSEVNGPRFWPAPILRVHVTAGYNGPSSGRGLAGTY